MMANYKGSLPSGEAFGTEKEDKKQAAAIRKAAAAKMATKTSPMDVIGDLAPYAGAIIGGVASGGNPQAIQAGYEGGKALGGMVGGDQERREEVLSEATEEEMALDNPEAAAKMRQARQQKGKAAQSGSQPDPFAQALAIFEKYQKKGA
jgi:hypothetical protein